MTEDERAGKGGDTDNWIGRQMTADILASKTQCSCGVGFGKSSIMKESGG